jgi:hypothetical protein
LHKKPPHALFAHVGVACETVVVHVLPHVLQLFGSVAVSTHVEPHSVGVLAGQPETHV